MAAAAAAACLTANYGKKRKENRNLLWQGDASAKRVTQRRLRASEAQCSSAGH